MPSRSVRETVPGNRWNWPKASVIFFLVMCDLLRRNCPDRTVELQSLIVENADRAEKFDDETGVMVDLKLQLTDLSIELRPSPKYLGFLDEYGTPRELGTEPLGKAAPIWEADNRPEIWLFAQNKEGRQAIESFLDEKMRDTTFSDRLHLDPTIYRDGRILQFADELLLGKGQVKVWLYSPTGAVDYRIKL